MPYYVIFAGRKRGIVKEWDDCKALINGFPNNEHRRYNTWDEAEAAFLERCLTPEVWESPDGPVKQVSPTRRADNGGPVIYENRGGMRPISLVLYGNFLFISGFLIGFTLSRLMK